jgi:hypothetical protein
MDVVERPLETAITLVLTHVDQRLVAAHDALYPERVVEGIPLSLTLLYPWVPAAAVTPAALDELHAFFAARPLLDFALVRVEAFPGAVVYAVPEPDDELRATMDALWAKYPEHPPYGRPGNNPPPHATLGRLEGPSPTTLDEARATVERLLPVHCRVTRASLMVEYEPDRVRYTEHFPFGGSLRS